MYLTLLCTVFKCQINYRHRSNISFVKKGNLQKIIKMSFRGVIIYLLQCSIVQLIPGRWDSPGRRGSSYKSPILCVKVPSISFVIFCLQFFKIIIHEALLLLPYLKFKLHPYTMVYLLILRNSRKLYFLLEFALYTSILIIFEICVFLCNKIYRRNKIK